MGLNVHCSEKVKIMVSLFVVFSFLTWRSFSSISSQFLFAVTFNYDLSRLIEKVCRAPVCLSAWVSTLPHSLDLPLLVVSLVGISQASLFSSTWWLRSDRVSLMDYGVFLPPISEALIG